MPVYYEVVCLRQKTRLEPRGKVSKGYLYIGDNILRVFTNLIFLNQEAFSTKRNLMPTVHLIYIQNDRIQSNYYNIK